MTPGKFPTFLILSKVIFCTYTSSFRFFYLLLLPSIRPVSFKFGKLTFLFMCPRNFTYLLLMLSISVVYFFHKTSLLLTGSVHYVLSILL